MAEFFSEIKTILCRQEKVYEVLSDMNSLERIKNQIPHEKVKDFIFDRDSCSFEVSPVGKVKFSIAEKNPPDSIKLTANESPIEVFMWVKLSSSEPEQTQLQLMVDAKLNPFLKPMLSAPLEKAIKKIADVLEAIPFNQI